MKRTRTFVGRAVVSAATVATLATTVGVLAPAASADPKPAELEPADLLDLLAVGGAA